MALCSMANQRRLPNGRFAKVRILPDKLGPGRGGKNAGGYLVTNTAFGPAADAVHELNTRVSTALLSDPEQRAQELQGRLRGAAAAAYTRSATGRFARGIFA